MGCDDHYLGRAQLTTTDIFSPLFQGFYGPLNQTQRTFKCLQSSCFHLTIANTSEDFLLELPLPGRHLLWLRLYLLATEQFRVSLSNLARPRFKMHLQTRTGDVPLRQSTCLTCKEVLNPSTPQNQNHNSSKKKTIAKTPNKSSVSEDGIIQVEYVSISLKHFLWLKKKRHNYHISMEPLVAGSGPQSREVSWGQWQLLLHKVSGLLF